MTETYCGKKCDRCQSRIELNCPGCKYGPGTISGGCSIAKCCVQSGYSSCDTCTKQPYCQTIKAKDVAPEVRLKRLQALKAEKEELERKAPILGDYLYYIFWATITNVAISLFTQLIQVDFLAMMAECLITAFLAYCYWKMSSLSPRYKKAAVLYLVILVLCIVAYIIAEISNAIVMSVFGLLMLVAAIVVMFLCQYNEMNGHSEQTGGMDNDLSDKWLKLWTWFCYSIGAMAFSFVILLLIPPFGSILLLASAVAALIVQIIRMKCLYNTALLFRDIAEENN